MRYRSEYIMFRKLGDKLIALDEDNYLTSWSVSTGKLIEYNKVKTPIDFKEFRIYKCETTDLTYTREWYQPMCLL